MSRSSRLTLLCASLMVVIAMPAYAETAAPAQPAESQTVPQTPNGKQDRPVPSGCPYRDGKLELIV